MVKVLELGCGNSRLSEGLYNDGITAITCIDLSAVAVEKMQERLLLKGYKGLFVDLQFYFCIFSLLICLYDFFFPFSRVITLNSLFVHYMKQLAEELI